MDQQVKEISKNKKRLYITIPLVFFGLSMVGVFQNCAKKNSGGGDSNVSSQSAKEEDKLFRMLSEAISVSEELKVNARMIAPNADLSKLNGDWEGEKASESLVKQELLVYDMITKQGYATNSIEVLKEVDELLNYMTDAKTTKMYQMSVLDNIDLFKMLSSKIAADIAIVNGSISKLTGRVEVVEVFKDDYKKYIDETVKPFIKQYNQTQVDIKNEIAKLDEIRDQVCAMDLKNYDSKTKSFPIKDDRFHGEGLEFVYVPDYPKTPIPADKNGCVGISTVSCPAFKTIEAITQCKNFKAILDNHQQQLNSLRTMAILQNTQLNGLKDQIFGADYNPDNPDTLGGIAGQLGRSIRDVNGTLGTRVANLEKNFDVKDPASVLSIINKQLTDVNGRVDGVSKQLGDFKYEDYLQKIQNIGLTAEQITLLNQMSDYLNNPAVTAKKVLDIYWGGIHEEKGHLIYEPIRNTLNQLGVLDVGITYDVRTGGEGFDGKAFFSLTTAKNTKGERPFFVILSRNNKYYKKVLGSTIYMGHGKDVVYFRPAGENGAEVGSFLWKSDKTEDEAGHTTGDSGDPFLAVVIPAGIQTKVHPEPTGCGDFKLASSNPEVPIYNVGSPYVASAAYSSYPSYGIDDCRFSMEDFNKAIEANQLPASPLDTKILTKVGSYGGFFTCKKYLGITGSRFMWEYRACPSK